MSAAEIMDVLKTVAMGSTVAGMFLCAVIAICTFQDFIDDSKIFFKMAVVHGKHYYTNQNFQIRFDEVVKEFYASLGWTFGPVLIIILKFKMLTFMLSL